MLFVCLFVCLRTKTIHLIHPDLPHPLSELSSCRVLEGSREPQLSAGHLCVLESPRVITDCPPDASMVHLHAANQLSVTQQTNKQTNK